MGIHLPTMNRFPYFGLAGVDTDRGRLVLIQGHAELRTLLFGGAQRRGSRRGDDVQTRGPAPVGRQMARDLFYNPGTAAKVAADWILQTLELPVPGASRKASRLK